MAPKVSVVMPTYNQGDHIYDAVDSVMNQRRLFDDFEFILVVDGPPDRKTGLMMEMLQKLDMKVVHNVDNLGTASALNAGFEKAEGEYWTWVSSDNVMSSNWLLVLVSHLEHHPEADVVYSTYNRQPGSISGGIWCATSGVHFRQGPYSQSSLISNENCFVGPSFLYRRQVHENTGEHRGAISHDYDWWLRAEEACGYRFMWVDQCLCDYRVHNERVTVVRRNQYDARHWRSEAMMRRMEERRSV